MAKAKDIDFSKLNTDIIEAIRLGQIEADSVEDKGTCNLEITMLSMLDGIKLSSIEKSGIQNVYQYGRGNTYCISCGFGGQADKNYFGNKAVVKYLKSQGWDCYIKYQTQIKYHEQ